MSKRLIHTSIKDIVSLMAAQSGISFEQASVTFRSIIAYMQHQPVGFLHRAVNTLFSKKNDDDALLN